MRHPTSPALAQRLSRRAPLLGDFLAVARAGGIRAASEKVHVTQSALTRRIQELERALEVSLFERGAQGMSLTPFGLALRHHAEMVEMNCAYAASEISQLITGATGELRIAAGPAWAYELAPDAVATTKARLPGVTVSLVSALNDATLPMLDSGLLDVVLGGFPEVKERSNEIVYEPLLEVEYLVYGSTRHPLQSKNSVSSSDLARHPWVWLTEAVDARRQIALAFGKEGLEVPGESISISSLHAGFRIMADNSHLMVLPSTLKRVAGAHGLGSLRLKPTLGRYVAGLMYRPSLARLSAFSEFRSTLISNVARLD